MSENPSKYACFNCRVAFNRPRGADDHPGWDIGLEHACPNCGKRMYDVGRDFASPRRRNVRAWKAIERKTRERYRKKG